jgi:hypothetical protein
MARQGKAQADFLIRTAQRRELERLIAVYKAGYEGLEEYAETDDDDIRDYLSGSLTATPTGFWWRKPMAS